MSKPTIWMINQYSSTPETGMGGRTYYLGSELAKLGWNVVIIASNSHHLLRIKPKLKEWYKIDNLNGLKFVWLKMPKYSNAHSKKRIFGWFKFSRTLLRLKSLNLPKPNYVLQSSPSPIAIYGARELAKHFDSKLIFEVRDIWPLSLIQIGGVSPKHPFIKFLQYTEDYAYKHADIVISNLKYAYKHMITRGMKMDKFHWVPNGFSEEEFDNPEPLNPSYVTNFPKDKFIVGYAGTLGLANNLYSFIDAAEKLKNNSGVHFVLVGNGSLKPNLIKYVNSKKLNNVTFLDGVSKSQIPSVYSLFDVCYLSMMKLPLYQYGTSNNKFFEYLAAGKPIIYAVDSDGFNIVNQYKCGIEVPSGESSLIASAILSLQSLDEGELQQIGVNSRSVAEDLFTYSKLAQDFKLAIQ